MCETSALTHFHEEIASRIKAYESGCYRITSCEINSCELGSYRTDSHGINS